MMMGSRMARQSVAVAAQVPRRNLTQLSSEARRYSFAHAADDILAADTAKEMVARAKAHASEVGGRLKHGWFRDGVTHPNSDLPPDGLPRMTWEDKVMPYQSGNVFSYTPCQMVGTVLVTFGAFVGMCATAVSSSSAASKKAALAEIDAAESAKA